MHCELQLQFIIMIKILFEMFAAMLMYVMKVMILDLYSLCLVCVCVCV